MSPRLRTLALIAHVTCSVGWLGSVVAFLALAIAEVSSQDPRLVRAACLAMALVIMYVVLPLALGSLATGLVSSLGTSWGLFRHYWVLIKLLLTVVAVIVLLVQLGPIREFADAAADPAASVPTLQEMGRRSLVHAVGGVVVLLSVHVLGVVKPRGMTRYGWNKQHEA